MPGVLVFTNHEWLRFITEVSFFVFFGEQLALQYVPRDFNQELVMDLYEVYQSLR